MNVLVAYGSTRGSTAEIAEWIGETLLERGMCVDVLDAATVDSVAGYDTVVLGGALYAGRWHRASRRFARRFADELRQRPVWLFSSGPLDRTATQGTIAPVRQVARIAQRVGARGHATFGGRLSATPSGFIARRLARTMAGDYRDQTRVTAWAYQIAAELGRFAHDTVH
ncbi:flavodoxin domain-containing protein [Longispora sp. K20-0274]|uniref:flavodoxin domain-containing protein n=1 Tax=Longispora sp. K20-0274 TaxID=3088255 RepID=UPI00399B0FFA